MPPGISPVHFGLGNGGVPIYIVKEEKLIMPRNKTWYQDKLVTFKRRARDMRVTGSERLRREYEYSYGRIVKTGTVM